MFQKQAARFKYYSVRGPVRREEHTVGISNRGDSIQGIGYTPAEELEEQGKHCSNPVVINATNVYHSWDLEDRREEFLEPGAPRSWYSDLRGTSTTFSHWSSRVSRSWFWDAQKS